jgi:hypothetical protein
MINMAAESGRGTRHFSKKVTTGSTRIDRKVASTNVTQKELAKKQNVMISAITITQRREAILSNICDLRLSRESGLIDLWRSQRITGEIIGPVGATIPDYAGNLPNRCVVELSD